MSENTDPSSGGTFQADSLIDEQTANTKFIVVQSAAPSTNYDGSVFIGTDDNPPFIRVRDGTNTQWMTRYQDEYDTTTVIRRPFEYGETTLNGTFAVQYNGALGATLLHVKSNGIWWGAKKT